MVEWKPPAPNKAFLGAALGASESYEESVEADAGDKRRPQVRPRLLQSCPRLAEDGKEEQGRQGSREGPGDGPSPPVPVGHPEDAGRAQLRLLYPTLGALAILVFFVFLIGRQNRDLLRVRAYRDFFLRLIPPLSTGVFIAGLPFVMNLATVENYGPVLLVYLAGAAVL